MSAACVMHGFVLSMLYASRSSRHSGGRKKEHECNSGLLLQCPLYASKRNVKGFSPHGNSGGCLKSLMDSYVTSALAIHIRIIGNLLVLLVQSLNTTFKSGTKSHWKFQMNTLSIATHHRVTNLKTLIHLWYLIAVLHS